MRQLENARVEAEQRGAGGNVGAVEFGQYQGKKFSGGWVVNIIALGQRFYLDGIANRCIGPLTGGMCFGGGQRVA
ncbi:hypothetical protein GCM10027594_01210 [Hymenobacter agri]